MEKGKDTPKALQIEALGIVLEIALEALVLCGGGAIERESPTQRGTPKGVMINVEC